MCSSDLHPAWPAGKTHTHTLAQSHLHMVVRLCRVISSLCFRMFGDSVMPLPHISRIKGGEVFCPLDPPPPYEAVVGSSPPPPLPVQVHYHWQHRVYTVNIHTQIHYIQYIYSVLLAVI